MSLVREYPSSSRFTSFDRHPRGKRFVEDGASHRHRPSPLAPGELETTTSVSPEASPTANRRQLLHDEKSVLPADTRCRRGDGADCCVSVEGGDRSVLDRWPDRSRRADETNGDSPRNGRRSPPASALIRLIRLSFLRQTATHNHQSVGNVGHGRVSRAEDRRRTESLSGNSPPELQHRMGGRGSRRAASGAGGFGNLDGVAETGTRRRASCHNGRRIVTSRLGGSLALPEKRAFCFWRDSDWPDLRGGRGTRSGASPRATYISFTTCRPHQRPLTRLHRCVVNALQAVNEARSGSSCSAAFAR